MYTTWSDVDVSRRRDETAARILIVVVSAVFALFAGIVLTLILGLAEPSSANRPAEALSGGPAPSGRVGERSTVVSCSTTAAS
jgi:hypothetical protein